MCELMDFNEVVWRASQGDETASAELVREFEPFIQRVARIRMREARGLRSDSPRIWGVGCLPVGVQSLRSRAETQPLRPRWTR